MFLEILFIALGLVFGSFFTAFSFRFPKGISIVSGRSYCPKCKHKIAWYDNVPVLSFLFLRGRCRNCTKHISWRYPLIEITTALGFLLIWQKFSFEYIPLFTYLVVFSILILIFIIDLEHQIIPDYLTFSGMVFYLLFFSLLSTTHSLYSDLLAGFASASFLLLINLFTKGRGMGLGDVKFAVMGGIIIGLKFSPIWLFLSFLTGGVAGIILILLGRAALKDRVAFGPFLITGLLLTFVLGSKLLSFLGF